MKFQLRLLIKLLKIHFGTNSTSGASQLRLLNEYNILFKNSWKPEWYLNWIVYILVSDKMISEKFYLKWAM